MAGFLVTCFLMWNDQMEAATLREEDKALISRIGGKMGDENMMQGNVDIVRQLRDLIREREEPLLTDPSHRKQREERRLKVEQLNAKSLSGHKNRFQPCMFAARLGRRCRDSSIRSASFSVRSETLTP